MRRLTEKQLAASFWIFLIIIAGGNIILIAALFRHLFMEPAENGDWLIGTLGTEIVGAAIFAWKFYFDGKTTDTETSTSVRDTEQLVANIAESSSSTDLDESSKNILEQVNAANIRKIIPSRKYYSLYGSTLQEHVARSTSSLTMISVNLMTGVPFENLMWLLGQRIKSEQHYKVTISLLNPNNDGIMLGMSNSLDFEAEEFRSNIRRTLEKIVDFRDQNLSSSEQDRLSIRVHNSVPFASAIIHDYETDHGSLQIESKIYKAPVNASFAIELAAGGEAGLYENLLEGYLRLLKEGTQWPINGEGK